MIDKAIVFPGQGSQAVGMLQELSVKHPAIIDDFSEVSNVLGFDYWQLAQEGPTDLLNQTEFTQVVMLIADVVIYKAMLRSDNVIKPKIMAGHSLGEYAALVCAGSIDLVSAAKLVRSRGRLMQATIPLGCGAMAAIVGLEDNQVEDLCAKASNATQLVTPANYNAVGQIVIAGDSKAVERAILIAQEMNAKLATLIPVSVPCHCPLLNEAALQFTDVLAEFTFKIPEVKVISNVDLSEYKSDLQIKALLAKQLYSPVQWVKTIRLIQESGIKEIYECGPGKVLSGLIKRIDRSLHVEQITQNLLK